MELGKERPQPDQPSYRPDSDIAYDVGQALWADEVIRVLEIKTISVVVDSGVVVLNGHVTTPTNKARAERVARQVPGVLGVENRLVTDGEVVVAVSQALARDVRTRGQRILVNATLGVISLKGRLDSAEVRAAAEEVAAAVPQVRGVINLIQAPGVVVNASKQRALQPRIGQEVYARDMLLGHVEWVMISLRHRRVTAFVVHGSLPSPDQSVARASPEERWLTIPVEVVRDVTVSGVTLSSSGREAVSYPDFDSADFVTPDERWQPPYPYKHTEVLLDLGRATNARDDLQGASGGHVLTAEQEPEGMPKWQRIGRGTPVRFLDGDVGEIDHVRLDPHGRVVQIVIRAGGLLPKDTAIPLDWVRQIDDAGIFVEVAAEQLAALPEARLNRR